MPSRKLAYVVVIILTCIWPLSLSFVPLQPAITHLISLRCEDRNIRVSSFESDVETDRSIFQRNEASTWQSEAELKTNELLHLGDEGTWDIENFERVYKVMKTWAQRPNRKAAVNLERLLRRVIEEKRAGNARVDSINMLAMYNLVVRSWARTKENGSAQRVEEIFDTMQSFYEMGEIYIKPDIDTFNGVLLAYSSSRAKDAPKQAMRVLQKLHDLRSDGKTDILPDGESYAIVLRAFASSEGPDAPELVIQMIRRMEQFASDGYPDVKPDYRCHNVYLNCLLNMMTSEGSNRPAVATQAEEYLYTMRNSEDDDTKPDVWSWNMVISAWSRSGDWDMTDKAEVLVAELERYHAECGYSSKTEPNTNTYNCLIACYSRSSVKDKALRAHAVLEKMKDRYHRQGRLVQRPDSVTYNSVMSAYAKSREKDAPQKVEELLYEMYESYEGGDSHLKPSSRSYNTCFDAWAKSKQPEAADHILEWIERMQHNYDTGKSPIAPNKWTYNAYLEALSKLRRPGVGDEAERVLRTMDNRARNGQSHIKPDVLTFTNVIHCIAVSGADDAFERAYSILLRMEDLHASGYGDVRPNCYTYNCVINAVAKSKLPAKAKIALKLLRRMKSVSLRPLTITYNNILNACAFSDPEEENKQEILLVAMTMLKEAQESCGANFITYGTALRVIGSFEDDSAARWRLVRDVFRTCCAEGQLNRLVMNQVKYSVTPSQYSLLRQEASEPKGGRLRYEYTVNTRKRPPNKKSNP